MHALVVTQIDQSLDIEIILRTHISSVGIAGGRADASVALDVLKGIVHEPPIAASITILPRTVHQLLLTQADKVPRLLEVLAFQGTCSTECPAGATLTLVLYL